LDYHYNNILFSSNVASQSDVTPKHGAIITCGSKIIATGFNKNECPRKKLMLRYGPVKVGCRIHAEYDCLYNLITSIRFTGNNSIRRKKLDIYVARDSMLNSKPCFHCIQVLKHFGIKRVYYSSKDNKTKDYNKETLIVDNMYVCEKVDLINTDHISYGNKFHIDIYLRREKKNKIMLK